MSVKVFVFMFRWLYMKRRNEYEYLNESNDVVPHEKSARLKSKTLSSSNYGTIVKP